jgi:hypothetical protein
MIAPQLRPDGSAKVGGLYRGSRPIGEGPQQLKALGVDVVIDLQDRLAHTKPAFGFNESKEIPAAGMEYVRKPINPVLGVKPEHLQDILDTIESYRAQGKTVYIHCMAGEDRTGFVAAFHRVMIEHWSPESAHAEWLEHGYHPRLFYSLDTYFRQQLGMKMTLLDRTLGRWINHNSFHQTPIVDPRRLELLQSGKPFAQVARKTGPSTLSLARAIVTHIPAATSRR